MQPTWFRVTADLKEVIEPGKAEVEPNQRKEHLGPERAQATSPISCRCHLTHMPAGHAVTRQPGDTTAAEIPEQHREAKSTAKIPHLLPLPEGHSHLTTHPVPQTPPK